MLNDMNLEKMLLWYHDLYKKYEGIVREKEDVIRFLRSVVEWFEQGHHKKKKDKAGGIGHILFLFDKEYLKGAKDPFEAIKNFLTKKRKREKGRDIFE